MNADWLAFVMCKGHSTCVMAVIMKLKLTGS